MGELPIAIAVVSGEQWRTPATSFNIPKMILEAPGRVLDIVTFKDVNFSSMIISPSYAQSFSVTTSEEINERLSTRFRLAPSK